MAVPYIVTKSHKNVGIAILLTLFLGPIGLFYASVTGGLIMTLTPIIAALTLIFGLFQREPNLVIWSFGFLIFFALFFWLINIIWAIAGVISYNREIDEDARTQLDLWTKLHQNEPAQIVINVNQKSVDTGSSSLHGLEVGRPALHEWLRNNPGKSINDYYSKFK